MNELNMLNQIRASEDGRACPDFADLLRRIEADGGRSTAPCTTVGRSRVGTVAGAAAAVVAVAALSAVTIAGIGASESISFDAAAPAEPGYAADSAGEVESEAPEVMDYEDNFSYTDIESADGNMSAAEENFCGPDGETVSDGDVSDSDVSDSDVSDGDAREVD